MMFTLASVLVAASLLPVAFAVTTGQTEGFNYDPATTTGPLDWPSLVLEGKVNECGGGSQSGIDVPTGPCDELNSNYIFEVRRWSLVAGCFCIGFY
jgi:hypothetical protein